MAADIPILCVCFMAQFTTTVWHEAAATRRLGPKTGMS